MFMKEHSDRRRVRTVAGFCPKCEGAIFVGEQHACSDTNARTGAVMKRYCQWWGEGRGQCVLREGHEGGHAYAANVIKP